MTILLVREVLYMTLFELRKTYDISQSTAANIIGIPLRTYVRYESDEKYGNTLKRESMVRMINDACEITEEKGLLSVEVIKAALTSLFDDKYPGQIDFCYLFGSYAKGYAKENSDVDLCVSTNLTGLEFVGLSEEIRNVLHKKIDLIRFSNLKDNLNLISEIMKDGVKIYEQH